MQNFGGRVALCGVTECAITMLVCFEQCRIPFRRICPHELLHEDDVNLICFFQVGSCKFANALSFELYAFFPLGGMADVYCI